MTRSGSKIAGAFGKGFDTGFHPGLDPSRFDLPHAAIHPRWMLLLHQVIEEAFKILLRSQLFKGPQLEDEITVQLHSVLENDLRQRKARREQDAIAGFDEGMFEAILRHTGATNFNGQKLKKEPDLYFKLKPSSGQRVLATEYAIFVECKPVDTGHSAGGDYCDKGLIRFVEGDYAWAMQDALMIGYVKGRQITNHLIPAMATSVRMASLATSQPPTPLAPPSSRHEPVHVSHHRRSFPWSWGKGKACDIRIYHSWHDVGVIPPPAPAG